MPKMTDQEFDNLFREAANRISPPPQPEAWEDMEQRLESAERDARARNISLYAMVGLLLLYSFLVPDTLKFGESHRASVMPTVNHQASQEGSTKIQEQIAAEATNESTSPSEANTEQDPSPGQQAVSGDNAHSDEGSASERVSSPLGKFQEQGESGDAETPSSTPEGRASRHVTPPSSSVTENIEPVLAASSVSSAGIQDARVGTRKNVRRQGNPTSTTSKGGLTSTHERIADRSGDVQAVTHVTGVEIEGDDAGAVSGTPSDPLSGDFIGAGSDNSERPFLRRANINHELAVPSTDPLSVSVGSPEFRKVAVKRTVDLQRVVKHPLFVRLALSPDYSSIDYGKTGKAGVNLGPMVEYSISPRFSISTGAIWSKKLYDQKDPEKTYGQGPGAVQADMLDANCRIIDLPLNVTYYLFPGRKTSLFVTAGASSYLMLDEKYVYTVYNGYYNYEYEESYSNKNMEWFSMLNLSIGVQHQVGKRCFIQGEPFFKAPMKGVGQGKVDLVSAGVFVSLKYWINP